MMHIHTELTWKGDEELIRDTANDPAATAREKELAVRLVAARDKINLLEKVTR